MASLPALLRRHATLLFVVCIAVLAALAALQTVRLHYLEQRHAEMFSRFGKAQLDFQFKAGELQRKLDACQAATSPSTPP